MNGQWQQRKAGSQAHRRFHFYQLRKCRRLRWLETFFKTQNVQWSQNIEWWSHCLLLRDCDEVLLNALNVFIVFSSHKHFCYSVNVKYSSQRQDVNRFFFLQIVAAFLLHLKSKRTRSIINVRKETKEREKKLLGPLNHFFKIC